jgi:hypothetical protein
LLFNICRKQHEFLRIEESHEGKWDTPLQWKQSCESKRTGWLEELRKKRDVEMKDCACVEENPAVMEVGLGIEEKPDSEKGVALDVRHRSSLADRELVRVGNNGKPLICHQPAPFPPKCHQSRKKVK